MFYDIYKGLCKERGLSCKHVAIDIGLSNSVTSRWKSGTIPNGETLLALAEYFGVSVDYLLGHDNAKEQSSFYRKFLELCENKGHSPSRCAEEAGFSKSLISKWKSGDASIPSPDILVKLSCYFDVSVSELIGEPKPTMSKEEMVVALMGGKATQDQIEEILFFISFLKARDGKRE